MIFLPPKTPCAGLTAGKDRQYGDMVKLAVTLDSNSSVERRVGSNPTIPTSSFADGQVLEYWQIGKTVDCWTDSLICRSDGIGIH